MSGWRVERLNYSRSPWRIITADGVEVTFESEIARIHGRDEMLPVLGYQTKADAVAALGRCAEKLWERVEQLQAEAAP